MNTGLDQNGDALPPNQVDPEELGELYLKMRRHGATVEQAIMAAAPQPERPSVAASVVEELEKVGEIEELHVTTNFNGDMLGRKERNACCGPEGECRCKGARLDRTLCACGAMHYFDEGGNQIDDCLPGDSISLEQLAKNAGVDMRDVDEVDVVNHPPHYNFGTFEVLDVIEDWDVSYMLGNVIKYVARSPHKGNPIEDLRKAQFYLNREIERLVEREERLEAGS